MSDRQVFDVPESCPLLEMQHIVVFQHSVVQVDQLQYTVRLAVPIKGCRIVYVGKGRPGLDLVKRYC